MLTFDPQGQGQSDTFGESPDQNEGFPAQTDGRPFFDGTEDAIDFFLSTPQHPYEPVAELRERHEPRAQAEPARRRPASTPPTTRSGSCSTRREIGLAGHSYGAAGVSYIGQWDPRVKAIVAWDNLGGRPRARNGGSFPPGEAGCPADPAATRAGADHQAGARHVGRLRPAADAEHLAARSRSPSRSESLAYTKAGVDTGEIIIRGGSHLDFSFIPNPAFGGIAARRGRDRLVHDRLVRQVREARPERRPAPADEPLAPRRRPRPRSTPTTTATCSRSTTPRGSTSACAAAGGSTARTCAPGCAGHESTATATGATTRTWRSTARRIDQRRGRAALTPRSAASTSRRRSTSPRMPATASLKRKASASFTIA